MRQIEGYRLAPALETGLRVDIDPLWSHMRHSPRPHCRPGASMELFCIDTWRGEPTLANYGAWAAAVVYPRGRLDRCEQTLYQWSIR